MPQESLFTCISCSIAFLSAEEQRTHYRSDHHRYNMKRRVASLPPVSASVFNQKVLDRQAETAVPLRDGGTCDICRKTYATENAYRSHLQSKKHKDNELKAAPTQSNAVDQPSKPDRKSFSPPSLVVSSEASEEDINQMIDAKIAAARSRLSSSSCLFCPQESPTADENLNHMTSMHSFFIPDSEYLIDPSGLILYLAEKISIGNACLYCSSKGKEFRSLDAVRKHMLDKSHCKISYDTEEDRLEYSDFYDFSSSYPPNHASDDDNWEDMDENDQVTTDEIVEDSINDTFPENRVAYGDTDYELVLPSGARIGHRSMRRYYAQSFRLTSKDSKKDAPSNIALVRQLLKDKNSALVPRRGGFGAFGMGTEVVKARNRGEAKEAGRHIREFRDRKRREDFKTKVGFVHNHQKHYRDPLLQ